MASYEQLSFALDTKRCPECKIVRLRSEFSRNRQRKDGLCHRCKVCTHAYYERTREHQIEVTRRWCQANPRRHAANAARWSKKNPEYGRAMAKQYRDAHKGDPELAEKERERQRKKWDLVDRYRPRKRNPETRKAAYHRYRSRLKNAEGKFTAAEWISCKEAHGNVCANCGEAKKLCADHIIPISKGGSNYITNIQPLCFSCNSRKRDKMPHELVRHV